MSKHRWNRAGWSIVGMVLATSACSDDPAATSPPDAPTATSAPTAARTTYPLTITDCQGEQMTFDRAPERVVTLDPQVTEILVSLGLEDRIAGATFFSDGDDLDLWQEHAATLQSLTMINDPDVGWPSKETVVAAKADFVATSIAYSYDAEFGVATREGFAQLGIESYLTHGACDVSAAWSDLSPLYEDIRDFGMIFDVQDRAESEIAALETAVAEQQPRIADADVPDYAMGQHYGGTDMPLTNGVTTANAIIELAGSHYALLDDDDGNNGSLTWEVFVDRDPDVIWLISGVTNTADEIRAELESDPRLASVTAVKNHAYVEVAYADVQESPRIIDGLTSMVDGLIALHGS